MCVVLLITNNTCTHASPIVRHIGYQLECVAMILRLLCLIATATVVGQAEG